MDPEVIIRIDLLLKKNISLRSKCKNSLKNRLE